MALALDTTLHDTYRVTYVADTKPDGTVYRAVDRDGRRVLVAGLPQLDDEELNATADLCHHLAAVTIDGLLPLKDHFAEGRVYYLVCDDPGGQDLDRYVREWGGPMPEAHVLRQMERLLQTLEALHTYKPPLYLGDLRSSDLWSNTNRDLLLTPFPLARPVSEQDYGYRAPELAKASEEADAPSDLYSFGVLFYQMLTGWMPPSGVQREAGTPLNAPRTLNGQISALAEQAVLRSLELKKANRYQAAYEMNQALKTVHMMAGRSLGMEVPPGMTTIQQPIAPNTPTPPPQPLPPSAPSYGTPSYAPQPAPNPGYAPPPQYGPPPASPYTQPYQMQPPPQPQRRSNTCLIITVIVLALLALFVTVVFVFVLLGPGRALFSGIASGSVPTAELVAPTAAAPDPAAAAPTARVPQPSSDPAAISVSSAATITESQALIEPMAGPVAYSPDGAFLALGLGPNVSVRNGASLEVERTLFGHTGNLNALVFSPDSRVLASGAIDDPTIRLWNAATGQSIGQIDGHEGWIRTLAFSPDGVILASGSTDTTIRLWVVATGQPIRTIQGHTDFVSHLAFSPDGATLASTSRDGTVRLWDVESGNQKPELNFTAPENPNDASRSPYWMTGLVFSPDGTKLAAGSTDTNVRLWNVATGTLEQTLGGHEDWVMPNTLAFSPDGRTLASGSLDGTVRLWDTTSGAERGVFSNNGLQILGLAFEPGGTKLATSSDAGGSLNVWDLASQEMTQSVEIGQGLVTSLAYSNDGAVLAAGGMNGTLRLHILEQDRSVNLVGSAPTSQAIAFISPTQLATLSDNGSVLLINLDQNEQPRSLSGLDAPALSVAVSADGSKIAAGSANGKVALWDARSGDSIGVVQVQDDRIFNLAFSPDGTLLAVGSNSDNPGIVLLNLGNGQQVRTLSGHEAPITALTFQPNGSLLASSSRDGTLRLWNTETGAEVQTIQLGQTQGWVSSMAFSPDGTVLATGALNGSITLWDPTNANPITALPYQSVGSVLALTFRPDGGQFAASLRDGSVRLFERRTS